MKKKKSIIFAMVAIIVLILVCLILSGNISKATTDLIASVTNYTFTPSATPKSTAKLDSYMSTYYEVQSSVYEFFDENNQYNILYTINDDTSKMEWVKLSSDMSSIESEISIDRYLSIFGNAIYEDGYLYVVYGDSDKDADSTSSDYTTAITIEVVKYDTTGNVIKTLEIQANQMGSGTPSGTGDNSTVDKYGVKYAFEAGNCDIAINNGVMKCIFAKQMYPDSSGYEHQMSCSIYVDTNDLELLNNTRELSASSSGVDEYYYATGNYWVSHSFAQRVIATSDGQFLSVDQGDNYPRGFYVAKTYKTTNGYGYSCTNLKGYVMFHFRKSTESDSNQNSTLSNLGNIVEVSDGYILVASSENTLSDEYASSRYVNESQNLFIQKYNTDFASSSSAESLQLLSGTTRSSESTTDYGVVWLTNYTDTQTVAGSRAIKIDDDKIAILWAEKELTTSSTGALSISSNAAKYYCEVIDNDGNVVSGPYELQRGNMTTLIDYNYYNGCIYWTETSSSNGTIVVHELNLNSVEKRATLELNKTEETITDSDITEIQLIATSNKTSGITWTTSNSKVATVDENGLVTIVGNGTATITASLDDYTNTTATYNITVDYKVKELTSEYGPDLEYNANTTSGYMTVTVSPSNANNKTLEWTSSDEEIATVESLSLVTGWFRIVTGEKKGTATITGSSTDGSDVSITFNVTVVEPITDISISGEKTVEQGATIQLTATTSPEDATESVSWKSRNEDILTVDENGVVTAVGEVGESTWIFAMGAINTSVQDYIRITITDPTVYVTDMSISGESSMVKGTSQTLSLDITPTSTTETIEWKSSNTSVLKVDSNGVVTAVGKGTATITAVSENVTEEFEITVEVPLESISLNKTEETLEIDNTLQLNVTYSPSEQETTDDTLIVWSSSNVNVATVSSSGTVVAKSAGNAEIKAETSNGLEAICNITVKEQPSTGGEEKETVEVDSIEVTATSTTLEIGESTTLNVKVSPEDASYDTSDITYTSSNSSILTVDSSGNVIAKSAGTAKVTVQINDVTSEVEITVTEQQQTSGEEYKPVEVERIEVTATSTELEVGESTTLNVKISPEDATYDKSDITYISSDSSILTVDSSGNVIAKSAGTAKVTVQINDVTSEVEITVTEQQQTSGEEDKPVEVERIEVTATSTELEVGESTTLNVKISPEDATYDKSDITYISSDSSILTVNELGQVTAKSVGTAIIAVELEGIIDEIELKVTSAGEEEQTEVKIEEITLSVESKELKIGDESSLKIAVKPDDTTYELSDFSFESSDPSILTVLADGTITAISEGTATITITSSNGVSNSIELTVVGNTETDSQGEENDGNETEGQGEENDGNETEGQGEENDGSENDSQGEENDGSETEGQGEENEGNEADGNEEENNENIENNENETNNETIQDTEDEENNDGENTNTNETEETTNTSNNTNTAYTTLPYTGDIAIGKWIIAMIISGIGIVVTIKKCLDN